METDPSACRLSRPLHPIFVSTAPQAHNIQQMRNWDAEAQQHCSKMSPCLPKSHTRIPAASVAVLPWRNYVFFLLAKGPLCYFLAVIHSIFPPTAAVDFYFLYFFCTLLLCKSRIWGNGFISCWYPAPPPRPFRTRKAVMMTNAVVSNEYGLSYLHPANFSLSQDFGQILFPPWWISCSDLRGARASLPWPCTQPPQALDQAQTTIHGPPCASGYILYLIPR